VAEVITDSIEESIDGSDAFIGYFEDIEDYSA